MTIAIYEPATEIHDLKLIRQRKCETYRHVITYAQSRSEIDPDRIGVWGTSYSGGLGLIVAALDRRVKCVVSQVPFISGYETMLQVMPLEGRQAVPRYVMEGTVVLSGG